MGRADLTNAFRAVRQDAARITYLDLAARKPAPPDMPGRATQVDGLPEAPLKPFTELKELRVLNLGFSQIDADGLRMLGPFAGTLEDLGWKDVRESTIARWRNSPTGRLEIPGCAGRPVTEKALATLQQSPAGYVILLRWHPRPRRVTG